MPNNSHASLSTLPVEILYSIFDRLDVRTIVLSIGNTCRQLRVVVQSYDRYKIDLREISYSHLKRIRRLMAPEKIQSLTVSQPIGARYWSVFRTKELTCVRTLTLAGIRESALRNILKLVNISVLVSLSVDIGEADRYNHTTGTYLTSILMRAKLHKLILKIPVERIEHILLGPSIIKYLELAGCIPFKQINRILPFMPHLETFIIDSCSIKIITRDRLVPFNSVKLFTMNNLKMIVDHLEMLLRLMPSLTHLKLIGYGNFFNGHRWEQFIQTKLPLLEKFEFSFTLKGADRSFISGMERTVQAFQTPYWLEIKRWFVKCECTIDSPESVQLYSIPLCALTHPERLEQTNISMSTINTGWDRNTSIHICSDMIFFSFPRLINSGIEQNLKMNIIQQISGNPIFNSMKTLVFTIHGSVPAGWTSIISKFIDLTRITSIALAASMLDSNKSDIVLDIKSLLEQACNASTLTIKNGSNSEGLLFTVDDICLLTTARFRHLRLSDVKSIDFIRIVERLEYLSSVEFSFKKTPDWTYSRKWFKTKQGKMSIRTRGSSFYVIFERDSDAGSNEINSGDSKRIKWTDDRHD